jgi:uncharacterized protein (TIGR02231 family)
VVKEKAMKEFQTMKTVKTLASASSLAVALVAFAGAAPPQESAERSGPVVERPQNALPITEVVVYEDRALVTREGEVPATGKVETVVVGGLPPALLETSLRAGLVDPAQGKVISVSSQVQRQREIQDTKLRAVEEEKRSVARQIAEVDDEIGRIAAREAYLDAYEKLTQKAVSERTGGGEDPQTARWAEAMKFVREGRAAALTGRREAERKREVLARKHGDLEAEAVRLRRPQERSARSAEVALESAAAGRVKLRLSYVISGAGWSPRYDARFDQPSGELSVTYFGEIRQQTGEDWKDARLVLSTARPSVGASRPQLAPLRLTSAAMEGGAKGKGIATREVASTGGLDLGFTGRGVTPLSGSAAALLTAESHENATAATFAVPGLAAIPADGRPHKVPVVSWKERAQTLFETVPRLQRFVYLKCRARNGSPHPMLAGAVDIFRGSGFIGTSSLKFVAPGQPFEISLGIEESLKVRRASTFDGWTGRGKEKRKGYDIEVANFGEKLEEVTILENYPVADIEEVQVRLDSLTTPPSEKNEKEGMLRWKLSLNAGEAKLVHLEYTIVYPKDYAGE